MGLPDSIDKTLIDFRPFSWDKISEVSTLSFNIKRGVRAWQKVQ